MSKAFEAKLKVDSWWQAEKDEIDSEIRISFPNFEEDIMTFNDLFKDLMDDIGNNFSIVDPVIYLRMGLLPNHRYVRSPYIIKLSPLDIKYAGKKAIDTYAINQNEREDGMYLGSLGIDKSIYWCLEFYLLVSPNVRDKSFINMPFKIKEKLKNRYTGIYESVRGFSKRVCQEMDMVLLKDSISYCWMEKRSDGVFFSHMMRNFPINNDLIIPKMNTNWIGRSIFSPITDSKFSKKVDDFSLRRFVLLFVNPKDENKYQFTDNELTDNELLKKSYKIYKGMNL